MANLISRVINKLNRTFNPDIKHKASQDIKTISIGATYGGWSVPVGFINEKSICYCAGAGEDISFDTGLVQRYGCNVWVLDPTPRAIKHFETLKATIVAGKLFSINNSPNEFYDLSAEKLPLLHYLPVGLWSKHDFLKFYAPQDERNVSHSIVNLQKTHNYFEAEVKRLKDVMQELGHTHLDLLKIDIEGAEYEVINSILEDKLDIRVICVEHDEYHQKDDGYLQRINDIIARVKNAGYVLAHIDQFANTTYVRKDIADQLKGKQ